MRADKVITFCADDNYMHHAEVLVSSIKQTNPDVHIYARLVNTDKDLPCEVFHDNRKLNTKKEFFKDRPDHLFIDYQYSFWHKRKGQIRPSITYSEQAAYACHKRFDNILHLLDKGYKSILALDVDSIVRKDITSLFEDIERNDLSAIGRVVHPGDIAYYEDGEVVTPTKECIGFYEEGILGTSNNTEVRSFWQEVSDQIDKELTDWNADCRILYKTFDRYRESLKLYQIPRTYKDKLLEQHTHIWSGDCIRKKTQRYIDERKKYQ
jgi:hypothetical protein